MFYMLWNEENAKNLIKIKGMVKLFTEVDEKGSIKRELGVNSDGVVVHKAPTLEDNYGLFDLSVIAVESLRNDISKEEFDRLWG